MFTAALELKYREKDKLLEIKLMASFLKYHNSKTIATHPILFVSIKRSMEIFQRYIIILIKPLHNEWLKKPAR
jgi:hypothetical protein